MPAPHRFFSTAANDAVARCDVLVIAVDRAPVRAWVSRALHRAGLAVVHVHDASRMFESLAAMPAGLVLGDPFDRAPAERLLAMVRATGCAVQTLVVAEDMRDALLATASALSPLELLREPRLPTIESVIEAAPPRMGPRRARARTWMRRCAELAAPAINRGAMNR